MDIALLKLFTKTYELSEVVLNQPRGFIIQNNKELNFSDPIELFSPPPLRWYYDYTLMLNATLEPNDYIKDNFHIELIKSGRMELKKDRPTR